MNDFFYFIDNNLIPALHSGGMAHAFPNITFVQQHGKWGAKNYLNGNPHCPKEGNSRWDKIFVSPRVPHMVKEQGGDCLSLIKFYQQQADGVSFFEAVEALAKICHLELPKKMDCESLRIFLEKQERLENICSKMVSALYTDKGVDVSNYLHNVRGYDDGFIEFAEFGYCSPEIAEELKTVLTANGGEPTYFSNLIGSTNILSLPYRSKGKIQGLVFRRIDGNSERKYNDVFISKGATKRYQLFGLSGLPPTGDSKNKSRDLIVVEGEIDALRCLYAGIHNVVAATGGDVSPEAMKQARDAGYLRATILFDSESTEKSQEKTESKVEKAIDKIRMAGIEPFVCDFGIWNGEDGERTKVDADTFLRYRQSEELAKIIKENTIAAPLWQYFKLRDKFAKISKESGAGRILETDYSEFRRRVIELAQKTPKRYDRERIYREFSEDTNGFISEESLREEAEIKLREQARLQSIEEIRKIAKDIDALVDDGKTDEAIALGKKLTNLSQINRESELAPLLAPTSLKRVKENYLNKPKGINTGYFFGKDSDRQELVIQAAALTYICAPTSHGKTTFLQNLALRAAQDSEKDGDVVFISFEESEDDITTEFLTLFIGERLSANTLRSIRSYYSGDGNFFTGDGLSVFQEKEAEFDKLLKSGNLRIYRMKNQLADLSGSIQYLNKNLKVKAVFVDYIQRIKSKEIRGTKKDVIESVCDDLMNLSLATGLPIVLGAQLNREAYSPLEMENQNLADASDIEHSANTIVLLWNSDEKPKAKSTKYYSNSKEKKLSDEAAEIESKGFNIGTRGTLYAVLSKNRGAEKNLWAVFRFDGTTRAITQLYPSHLMSDNTPLVSTISNQEYLCDFD